MKPGLAIDLGVRDYEETLALQRDLVTARQGDRLPDLVLTVEHPAVITLGRRQRSRDNVLDARFPVVEIERGGDATYHGPGQLVAYPIVKLDDGERDLHAYLRALEDALLWTLADFGLDGARRAGATGVWVGDRKLASIGIAVRKWVTLHGVALNVSTDLSHFSSINPCGFDAGVMSSMSALLGRTIEVAAVRAKLVPNLGRALGRRFVEASEHTLALTT